MRDIFCCPSSPHWSQRGFTLVEVVVTVFILAVIVGIAMPSLAGVRDQNRKTQCLSHVRQIQAAKDAYVLDHLGEGSPVGIPDREAVFRSYFVEGFTSQAACPLTQTVYPDIYNVYVRTACPNCGGSDLGVTP